LVIQGFTGAGLRSTFGLRGVEALGSGGTGEGVFIELGSVLVCGVDVARRRACVKALGKGLSARDPYCPLTTEGIWRRVAIDLDDSWFQ
jgi:hypothetical protein